MTYFDLIYFFRAINQQLRLVVHSPQENLVTIAKFLAKQLIDVIQWNESVDGILAYRYPMQDMEIQNGGQLTVPDGSLRQ